MGGYDLTEGLLMLGVAVIVPLALALHRQLGRGVVVATALAAAGVAVGFALPPSVGAAALGAPWLLGAVAWALVTAWRWWTHGRVIEAFAAVVVHGWLVIGAAWLAVHLAGLEPVGVSEPIVLLTGVHFHFAGFIAGTLAIRVRSATTADAPRLSATVLVTVVGAPSLVAFGFFFIDWFQAIGAAVLTVGLWLYSWLVLRHVAPRAQGAARLLLTVSALAVLVPMLLAVQWAAGQSLDVPRLSIPDMVAVHGTTNAIAFSLLGAIGWHLRSRGGPYTPGREPGAGGPR